MIHLRIVAPPDCAERALDLLRGSPAVINIVHLAGAAQRPDGDVILCDIARESASVLLSDLKELDIPARGSIAVEAVDFSLSSAADEAERAAPGLPTDAVVWEEVESRTQENTELSISYLIFMVAAMQIAAVGIVLDQPILIVGAMVVGPEFGPLAGEFLYLALQRGPLVAARLVLPDRLVDRHRRPGDGVHHDRSWRSSRVLRIPVSLHDLPGWDHSAR